MALVKATLASAIADALAAAHGQGLQAADTTLGNAIADAVDTFVKSGTVTTPAGVAALCPPPTGVGATTAPGIGTIS